MCLSPNQVANGQLVACRECWQCRERKINDWVGRCVAESKTSTSCNMITLTYGKALEGADLGEADHVRASVLTYRDVQHYFKRLRKNGYPMRYFAVGEYGSMKGRAHWHIIVFWKGEVPEHDLGGIRFMEKHWPHGLSHWDKVYPKSIRYVCKYIQKDMGKDERQAHLAMSKKPPLGDQYFRNRAETYVRNGLAPQDLFYTFEDCVDKHGEKINFQMFSVTADNFLEHYLNTWKEAYPGVHRPGSVLLDEYEDKKTREWIAANDVQLSEKPMTKKGTEPSFYPALMSKDDLRIDEKRNAYYVQLDDETRLYWSFTEEGIRSWQNVIRTGTETDELSKAYQAQYAKSQGR